MGIGERVNQSQPVRAPECGNAHEPGSFRGGTLPYEIGQERRRLLRCLHLGVKVLVVSTKYVVLFVDVAYMDNGGGGGTSQSGHWHSHSMRSGWLVRTLFPSYPLYRQY